MDNLEQQIKAGTPVNAKSLLAFLFCQMQKLNAGEIDSKTAQAQASLASQCSNLMKIEIQRAIVNIKLKESGAQISSNDLAIRQIESKSFSNTMDYQSEYVDDPNNTDI